MIGKFCIFRTHSAGVHIGTLAEINGTCALLKGTSQRGTYGQRRIWAWAGANTLHELSLRGASMQDTRISEPVEEILLTQVVEVIPCTEEAEKNLSQSRWWNPPNESSSE